MKQATRHFLAAVLVLLLWVTNSPAQNDGMRGQLFSFEGRVTEKEGPPAVSVGIELLSDKSDVVSATQTDVDGRYMLLGVSLSAAHYTLRFAKNGYSAVVREIDIRLGVLSDNFKFDVELVPSPPRMGAERGLKPGVPLAQVKVFYATDRKLDSATSVTTYLGAPSRSGLAFGSCDVSIPPNHRAGNIEAPSLWRLELSPDPEQHIVVRRVAPTSKEQFFRDLSQAISNGKQQEAFLFIHGYNVTFEDAIKRTAQLAYDMRFGGVPITYSWPSKGSLFSYGDDEKQIEATKEDLKAFLNDLQAQSGARQIYLVAHSMGNRALLAALSQLASETQGKALHAFKQVIFAAPDVAQSDFKLLTGLIARWSPHLTLYVSSHDQALLLSRHFHSGMTRAGDAEPAPLVLVGLDTIDVSEVSTEFLGHTYYGECKSVVADIIQVFRNDLVPRGLKPAMSTTGAYWMMVPRRSPP
jgi:esterase/lipase superfamily enzyme